MRRKPKVDFLTVLHLAEIYQEQYNELGLCLSPEQDEKSFRDFVAQYYRNQFWGTNEKLQINPNASF